MPPPWCLRVWYVLWIEWEGQRSAARSSTEARRLPKVASLAEEESKAAAVKAAAADERAAAVLAQVKEVARRQEQVLASAVKARNRAEAEAAR